MSEERIYSMNDLHDAIIRYHRHREPSAVVLPSYMRQEFLSARVEYKDFERKVRRTQVTTSLRVIGSAVLNPWSMVTSAPVTTYSAGKTIDDMYESRYTDSDGPMFYAGGCDILSVYPDGDTKLRMYSSKYYKKLFVD